MTARLTTAAVDDGETSAPAPVTPPTGTSRVRHLAVGAARVGGAALALPLGLYVVLRPENYGLTPNSLDPFFYTGYAINFDDVMNAVQDRHYFVSRWAAYYPGYVADAVAGPFVGRLLLRLALAALVLVSVWGLGRRLSWTRAQQFLIGVLVLTMPMFVRAFFTDYVEFMVVALGLCLVTLCLREQQTLVVAATVGALAALIVIANPIAITAVVLPLAAFVLLGSRSIGGKALVATTIVAAGALIVLGGLVLYRWRYGIHNVYQPSIDFVRTYRGRDLLKSPRIDWLWHFTWLFATPIMLLSAAGLAWRRTITFERVHVVAFSLAGAQYVYQWVDQFIRDGNGLEVSYYWSFAYPTFAVAMALFVGRLTAGARAVTLVTAGIAWVVFLLIGVPDAVRLPAGAAFLFIALAVVAAAVAVGRRSTVAAATIVVALVGWTQIGAPPYDPSAYALYNLDPAYDNLFRRAGAISEEVFREAVWFEQQMDTIENDASTSFVPLGPWASPIVGLYAPHVVAHMVLVDPETSRLTPVAVNEIQSGFRPIVAVLGPPGDVASMIATFPADLGVGTLLLDVTHDTALGYRLVVYAMPDSSILPYTWGGADLPRVSGRQTGNAVEVQAGDAAGFVTFGPYIPLDVGTYSVSLSMSSSESPGEIVGDFEVASSDGSVPTKVPIDGTSGEVNAISLTFEVTRPELLWEFRTMWNGAGTLTVRSITLAPG